jgi:hypothetical protein
MRNRIPRGHSGKWSPQDESKETGKCQELGNAHKPNQNPKIPRIHRLLQILHTKLFSNRTPAAPSHKKKKPPWEWTTMQQLAFTLLKDLICAAPVLIQPNFNKKFFL